METCLYKNNIICAYDVTNMNEVLNYDIYATWKMAGKEGKLICPECGQEVILKVKDPKKKAPHFSHKVNSNCTFNDSDAKESEEHKKGKSKLYHYFKEKYKDIVIRINKCFSNKRRCDVYMEFASGERLAVEFQRTDLDISEWKLKHQFYVQNRINDLWIINGHISEVMSKEKQIALSDIEKIMLNEDRKIAVYLDIEKSQLCLRKNMYYKDSIIENNDNEMLYSKIYNIEDVMITSEGYIKCDFDKEYKEAYEKYIAEKKEESVRMLEIRESYIKRLDKEKEEQINKRKNNEYSEKIISLKNRDVPLVNRYTIEQFKVGKKISHRTFGNAEIIGLEENFVIIKYDGDKQKRISLNNCLKGIVVKLIE